MSKLDLADAYKHVLVRPQDWDLLSCMWTHPDGTIEYFVDLTLPFGLRSSAKLFSDMAHALRLAMIYRGVSDVDNYLDDFITVGPGNTNDCAQNLDIMLDTCAKIGFSPSIQPK